jgi:hypothetical protein
MATPALLHGSEAWVSRMKEKTRIQIAEIRFLREVQGCTREGREIRVDESIRDELQIYSIKYKLYETRIKRREHTARKAEVRLPKQ